MNDQRGLTLLELLVALGLVGLVAVVALLSLRLASHAWERGEAKLDTSQRVRFVTDLLSRELRSALPYVARLDDKAQVVAFSGGPAAVRFLSATAGLMAAAPGGALREVTYTFGAGGLYRTEAPASDRHFLASARGVSVQLEPRVAEFSLKYLQRSSGTWLESWAPPVVSLKPGEKQEAVDLVDLFPGAVEVRLAIWTEDGRLEQAPPLVVTIRSQFPPTPKAAPAAGKAAPKAEPKPGEKRS